MAVAFHFSWRSVLCGVQAALLAFYVVRALLLHLCLLSTGQGYDPDKDVAVLKIDAPREALRPIAVGSSNSLKVRTLV